jgi:VWFA-related protein
MPRQTLARRALPVAALLLAGTGLPLAQQTPAPTFRTTTNLIVQPVTVKDGDGRPIEGLTAKDFVLTEDGAPQTIAFCQYQRLEAAPGAATAVTVPAQASAAGSVEPVTAETAALSGDSAYRGRRLLVLYFDLYNMPFFDKLRMYSGASTFVDTEMTADDLVAVMVFERGTIRLRQNFTDDRAALRGLIARLVGEADDENAGGGVAFDPGGGGFGEDDDTFNLFSTDRQLAALQTAVTDLGPLPEIKTLVYFGSGLRLSGVDNLAQLRATVNAAVRSSVTINPVDTRGLVAEPPLGDATRASPSGTGLFSGTLVQAASARQQQSQDTYYALAKDTGGRAMFDNNDLSLGIVQAARAVTGYYMLGYYTTNTATDGRFRHIKVMLADGRAADLSYRAGYYGAKDYSHFNAADKERQLEEALRAEDPVTDIPMAAEINYFQISSAEYFVPVSVRMPGSELTRPRPRGDTRAEIDMIGEIKDTYGVTIRNMRDKLDFTLDPARAADVARRPIQYETGFSLLPGQYVIKLLARDTTTGRIGTYQQAFTVPNLEREHARLPISTVVMTSQRVTRADALYSVQQKISSDVANPLVFDGRKLIPSVTRTYSAARPVYVFLQAYERDSTSVRPLEAYLAFYRAGVKVFETDPVALDDWDPKLRAVPIRFTLAAGTLAAGVYDCQVTVLDPTANKAAFWRASVEIVR